MRKSFVLSSLPFFLLASLPSPAAPKAENTALRKQVADAVSSLHYAVVTIHADYQVLNSRSIEYSNYGFGLLLQPALVLSPFSLIEGAQQITVDDSDNGPVAAQVIAWDAAHGLAVLSLDRPPHNGVPAVPRDAGDLLESGEPLLVAVNSMGKEPSVIFASFARYLENGMLQLQGILPPGTEGGAVFDLSGRLVGMAANVFSIAGESGADLAADELFVWPFHEIYSGIEHLLPTAGRPKVFLGVVVIDWPSQLGGAHVRQVSSGSPAEAFGLQVGDIILSLNNRKVANAYDLYRRIQSCSAGDTVDLRILRAQQILSLPVVLDSLPSTEAAVRPVSPGPLPVGLQSGYDRRLLENRIRFLETELKRLRRFMN